MYLGTIIDPPGSFFIARVCRSVMYYLLKSYTFASVHTTLVGTRVGRKAFWGVFGKCFGPNLSV